MKSLHGDVEISKYEPAIQMVRLFTQTDILSGLQKSFQRVSAQQPQEPRCRILEQLTAEKR